MVSTLSYKTWIEVSKHVLNNNLLAVRQLLNPGVKLMAVVKSNAYGHGLVETAKILCGHKSSKIQLSGSTTKHLVVESLSESLSEPLSDELLSDWLGVDSIDEAILLRQNGIKAPILVMGYTPPERFTEAVQYNLRLTAYNSFPDPIILNTCPLLHLKIDTGMSRQGVLVSDLAQFFKSWPEGLEVEGVYTHFANADNLTDRRYPNLQLSNFKKALNVLNQHGIKPNITHASATTGLLTMPQEAQFDMVRVGIALYGLWPSVEFRKKFKNIKIKPALSWKTRIVQIKTIKKGTPVGYGVTERVKKDTKTAILPVGYYDGYFRALSSIGYVLIGGQKCKILGRISMNLMVVDVSNVKNPKVWDEVVLIGQQKKSCITVEELADRIGTISYEIVSRINPLLPRIYI